MVASWIYFESQVNRLYWWIEMQCEIKRGVRVDSIACIGQLEDWDCYFQRCRG